MLHCGNEFIKQALNFCFELTFPDMEVDFSLNFQLPNGIRCSHSKLKSNEIIKCQLMTSYIFDPNNFRSA